MFHSLLNWINLDLLFIINLQFQSQTMLILMTLAGLEMSTRTQTHIANEALLPVTERNIQKGILKPLHIEFRSWLKQSDSGLERNRCWEDFYRGSAKGTVSADLLTRSLTCTSLSWKSVCHGIFPRNTTSHSESLRHGFSTRIHSQTRWRLKNNTHSSQEIILH